MYTKANCAKSATWCFRNFVPSVTHFEVKNFSTHNVILLLHVTKLMSVTESKTMNCKVTSPVITLFPNPNNAHIGSDPPAIPLVQTKMLDVPVVQCLFMQQCLHEQGYSTCTTFWRTSFDLTKEWFSCRYSVGCYSAFRNYLRSLTNDSCHSNIVSRSTAGTNIVLQCRRPCSRSSS